MTGLRGTLSRTFSTRLFLVAPRVLWNHIWWRYRILLGWGEIGASGCSSIRRWPGLLGPPIASYSRSRGPGRRSDAGPCTAGAGAALSGGTQWRNESPDQRHSHD